MLHYSGIFIDNSKKNAEIFIQVRYKAKLNGAQYKFAISEVICVIFCKNSEKSTNMAAVAVQPTPGRQPLRTFEEDNENMWHKQVYYITWLGTIHMLLKWTNFNSDSGIPELPAHAHASDGGLRKSKGYPQSISFLLNTGWCWTRYNNQNCHRLRYINNLHTIATVTC